MRRSSTALSNLPSRDANFIEPMECLAVSKLPEDHQWTFEIKLDGYRAWAVKSSGKAHLYSRREKLFNPQYPYLVEALDDLPDDTVVDGEVVSLDDSGKPNFHLLQQFRKEASRIHYFIFDLLICKHRDLTGLPLNQRREFLQQFVKTNSRVRISGQFQVSAAEMLAAVREQKLEGVVAKLKDSVYQPGKRTGAWIKYRVNLGQELVVGGYIPGRYGFDSLIVGYYRGNELVYVARVRNGFVPTSRRQVFQKIRNLVSQTMPFVNLPDEKESRWGDSLTAEKMKQCVWLIPKVVAQIEFLEWTEGDRLRHSKFVGLREDRDPRTVVKEQAGE